MKETDYMLVSRLTYLRMAEHNLREAVSYMNPSRRNRLVQAITIIQTQREADERKVQGGNI